MPAPKTTRPPERVSRVTVSRATVCTRRLGSAVISTPSRQRTADRVTQIARHEAERILTDADRQVAELQERITTLRAVEAELGMRVADRVKQSSLS